MSSRQPVSVEEDEPFASDPLNPTVRLHFPTTPGFSSGATVSRATAQELLAGLQKLLGDKEVQIIKLLGEKEVSPKVQIISDIHGMLWERPMEDGDHVTIAAEDHALVKFLSDAGPADIHITVVK